jgi:predicted ATPase
MVQGVLAATGQGEEGITQIHQGLAAYRATGATRDRPYYLALLAEASVQVGQTAEALATLAKSGVPWWEAEAETCVQQALAIARRQQASSLELRAAMSLSR